jgi:hypothetical protein
MPAPRAAHGRHDAMEGAVDEAHAAPEARPDFGRHNMAVVGREHLYLSHLPMFMPPHDAQLLLEAELERDGRSLMDAWRSERAGHPDDRLYTMFPEKFALSSLYAPDPPERQAFRATFFRGHLERGGEQIPGLEDVTVDVRSVIFARHFGSADRSVDLEYVMFGAGDERFLAHVIAAAPDFDQLLAVRVGGMAPDDDEIARGVDVTILDRPNTAATRLRDGETLRARGHVTGAHRFLDLDLDDIRELYFEEGELMTSRGAFEPTLLETEAGFGD